MYPITFAALEGTGSLDSLTTVVSQFFTWVGTGVSTIASTPILLLGTAIFCAGAVIGLMKRLIGH